jgi:hypothetical protein
MKTTIYLPFLPPSANQAYRRTRFGMTLSADAKVFQTAAKLQINRQLDGTVHFDPNAPHRLHLHFSMPDLLNKTYPKTAKTRFKKIDAANLEKLLTDLLCSTFGIDDSSIISNTQSKSLGKAGTTIVLEELPDSSFMEPHGIES